MIPQPIDNILGKLAALESALIAGLSTRYIFRGCEPYADRTSAQLTAGVLNILLDREGDYAAGLGRAAQEGSLGVLLVGYLQVDEQTEGKAVLQDGEAALAEELKDWVKAPGITTFDVQLREVRFSRQLGHPYGWIIAALELGPPRSNVY